MNKQMVLSYNELIKELKLNFNLICSLDDIRLYFEPTIFEEELDLKAQANILSLQYD